MISKRNKKLVIRHHGQIMPFYRLPVPAKLAIIHYMAFDGDAWPIPPRANSWSLTKLKKNIKILIPEYDNAYGNVPFGYVVIPTDAIVNEIMRDEALNEFEDFDQYHRIIVNKGLVPKHAPSGRWPVILSSFEDETLQDGWHRFHAYYNQGAKYIPAVFYSR